MARQLIFFWLGGGREAIFLSVGGGWVAKHFSFVGRVRVVRRLILLLAEGWL